MFRLIRVRVARLAGAGAAAIVASIPPAQGGDGAGAVRQIRASCGELRMATRDLAPEDAARFVELTVVGRLTLVESDGALAYLGLCGAPDPEVLCVTYETGGLKVGDMVGVSNGVGGYARPDADHVLLDPCLPSPAG